MLWEKYVNSLRVLVEDKHLTLNPAAGIEKIQHLENYLGSNIPDFLKQIYLVNDGQPVDSIPVFPEAHEFLPVDDVKLVYSQLSDVAKSEAGCLWKKEWLPIAQTIGGGVICFDITGADGVVQFYPEDETEKRLEISLDGYLESLIKLIEQNKVRYLKDDRYFTLKN